MKRAAIYCRVSTDKQESEGTSLGSQEQACRQYAAKHGFEVVESLVVLEQHTGAELFDRPKLTQIRTAVKANEIDAVIFYAVDRLSRNTNHVGLIVTECDYHGVALECVSEPFDNTPEGKLLAAVRGFVGEVEREKIRERTMRGKRAKAEAGRVPGSGIDGYGYVKDRERGVRVIREDEAAVVRRIFEWVAEGKSVRSVVSLLNAEGIPSPSAKVPGRSGRWWTSGTNILLRNPKFKGEAVAFRYEATKVQGRRSRSVKVRDEEGWIRLPDGKTPAIVSPELWDAVQYQLSTNTGAQTRNKKHPRLLRGVVKCATCGRTMNVAKSRDAVYYRCGSRESLDGPCGGKMVRADALEAWAWNELCEIINHPHSVLAMLMEAEAANPNSALVAERDAARKALEKLDKQAANLSNVLAEADDDMPLDVLMEKLKAIQSQRKAAAARVDAVVGALAAGEKRSVNVESFVRTLDRVKQNLRNAGFDEQRLAVEALVEDIVAAGKDRKGWRINLAVAAPTDGILSTIST